MRLRWVVVPVLVLALLAGGLVVASSVLHGRAEQRVSDRLVAGLGLDETPGVDLGGSRPFLLQLARGRLDDVEASMARVTFGGLTLLDAHLSASDVTMATPVRAGHLTVVGVVPTATVERYVEEQSGLDVALTVTGGAMRASGSVLGLELGISLVPRAEAGRLLVDVVAVDVAGVEVSVDELPDRLRQRLVGLEVPVTGLPDGLTVTAASLVPSGVRVTAGGTDVALPGATG